MGAAKAAVTEAVAEARGITVQTALHRSVTSPANPTPAPQEGGKWGVQAGTAGERKALSLLTLSVKGLVGE